MSALMNWLFDRTPSEADDAPPIPEHLSKPGAVVDEEGTDLLPPASSYELEEYYALMDYRAANGAYSRRRITMRSVGVGSKGALIKAVCHERRAIRTFRCDRIEGFIDDDGVVHEPLTFFREVFLIDLNRLTGASGVDTAVTEARIARDKLLAPLSVLVGIARSDEHVHPAEIDAICAWAEGQSMLLAGGAHAGDKALAKAFRETIQNMRPTRQAIEHHWGDTLAMCKADPQFARSFSGAVSEVIVADGVLAAGEEALLADLGIPITGR